jgi:hypothetical protein
MRGADHMVMFSLSSHNEPSGFDFEQDRDLIACMNEARSPEDLERLSSIASSRLRARSARASARRARRGISRGLTEALQGPERALSGIRR